VLRMIRLVIAAGIGLLAGLVARELVGGSGLAYLVIGFGIFILTLRTLTRTVYPKWFGDDSRDTTKPDR
jgi:hypothetical protein